MFYEMFIKLCNRKGVSPSAAAIAIGINKSTVSNWKNRGTSPTDATTQKIADYFGVPVSSLFDEKKTPTQEGERFADEDVKAAFFRGADPTLTKEEMDGLWEDAQNYMMYKISQRSRTDKNEQ